MKILRTVAELRQALEKPRAQGIIGLVPTMGALHEGHVVADARGARASATTVVASLFVNPAQFGDPADLQAYPRDEATDAEIASAAGVDILFAPAAEEVYRPGHATWVDVEGPARGLEGAFRPGHFRGVATVCLKLFLMVEPRPRIFWPEGRAAGGGRQPDGARFERDCRDPRRADGACRRRSGVVVAKRASVG